MLFCRVAQSLTTPLAYGGTQHGGLRPGTVSVGGAVALADALQDANGDTRRVEERAAHLASLAALVRAALYDLSAAGLVRLVVRRGVTEEKFAQFYTEANGLFAWTAAWGWYSSRAPHRVPIVRHIMSASAFAVRRLPSNFGPDGFPPHSTPSDDSLAARGAVN